MKLQKFEVQEDEVTILKERISEALRMAQITMKEFDAKRKHKKAR